MRIHTDLHSNRFWEASATIRRYRRALAIFAIGVAIPAVFWPLPAMSQLIVSLICGLIPLLIYSTARWIIKTGRWKRFGLATMLGSVTLSAVGVKFIEPHLCPLRLAQTVERLGGQVAKEPVLPEWFPKKVADVEVSDWIFTISAMSLYDIDDDELANLVRLPGVGTAIRIGFHNSRITDASAVHFSAFKECTHLAFDGASITDAALEHIYTMPKLRHLGLTNTKTSPCKDRQQIISRNGRLIVVWR